MIVQPPGSTEQTLGATITRIVIADDEPLVRERLGKLISVDPRLALLAECEDGEEAVRAILTHRPDLVFLDVQMPRMNGFEVVEAVKHETLPVVIFATAFDDYALRAFEVHAVDYLLKPFTAARFEEAVERALQRLSGTGADDGGVRKLVGDYTLHRPLTRFVARSGSKIYFVPLDDVQWIEGADNYLRLHVTGRSHLVRGTMKSVENRIDPERFVRVHRSIMVNVESIGTIEAVAPAVYEITMRGGTKLTTGRAYHGRVRAMIEH